MATRPENSRCRYFKDLPESISFRHRLYDQISCYDSNKHLDAYLARNKSAGKNKDISQSGGGVRTAYITVSRKKAGFDWRRQSA